MSEHLSVQRKKKKAEEKRKKKKKKKSSWLHSVATLFFLSSPLLVSPHVSLRSFAGLG